MAQSGSDYIPLELPAIPKRVSEIPLPSSLQNTNPAEPRGINVSKKRKRKSQDDARASHEAANVGDGAVSALNAGASGTSSLVSKQSHKHNSQVSNGSNTKALTKKQKKGLNRAEKLARTAAKPGSDKKANTARTSTNGTGAKHVSKEIVAIGMTDIATANTGSSAGANLLTQTMPTILDALQHLETRLTGIAEQFIFISSQVELLRKEQHDATAEVAQLTKALWDEKLRAG